MLKMSVETILRMIAEEELSNIDCAMKVADKVFIAENPEIIDSYLKKLEFAFLREDDVYRIDLIEHMISLVQSFSVEDMIGSCRSSIVGNVLVVCLLLENYELIDAENLAILQKMSSLKFLRNIDFFYFIPSNKKFKIALLEEDIGEIPECMINEIADVLESLAIGGIVEQSETTIRGILKLYGKSERLSKKKKVLEFLSNGDYSLFLAALKSIGGNFDDVIKEYQEIYYFLLKKGVPIYFDYMNIELSDVFSNKNPYPVLYQDMDGYDKLLSAFSDCPIGNVRSISKIFDIDSHSWVSIKDNHYKCAPEEIFSFRNMVCIANPKKESIAKVESLEEREIMRFIGILLQDPNRGVHGPTERADIFTVKLLLDNGDDRRNAAFVLKGKGFPRVHLQEVAHQIYKACELRVDVVILVFVGNIDDDSRNCLISTCESKRRIWCLIDSIDLARILEAYNMI